MKKYILVYQHFTFREEGGGTFLEDFPNEEEMHKRAEELIVTGKGKIAITRAGLLVKEFEYTAIQYAIKVEPKII
jgi:hypothetical protein